jgi:hypothetical protein
MGTSIAGRNFCLDCGHAIRGTTAEHVWTKAHQAVIAEPVSRRGARSVARKAARRFADQMAAVDPFMIDEEPVEATWKLCAGIPSLEVEAHLEPLEKFHRNRAYADGWYVKCHSCHQFYLYALAARKAEAAAEAA